MPTMRKERTGLRVGSIKGCEDRLTVLAFDTLEIPPCLVVAEAHYGQKGARPY